MPGFHLIVSNRMERLAEHLSNVFGRPPGDPFSPETIVVQSLGMERWLSLELARRNGISANIRFPFPNAFLESLFIQPPESEDAAKPFDPDTLAFRVLDVLPACLDKPEFAVLKAYLINDPDQCKRFQLVSRIADTFDQYLIFRPEMIFAWEKGKARHWQALLWRELCRKGSGNHRAKLRRMLLDRIENGEALPDHFPHRLFLFGISYLPLFHLQTFSSLSSLTDFFVYVVNPCQEFWADIVSDREARRIVQMYAGKKGAADMEDLHLERGNRLLAAMGHSARNFLSLVEEIADDTETLFDPPKRRNLLESVQLDIFSLEDPAAANRGETEREPGRAAERFPYSKEDRSIQLHSCHSPIREIESLHDQLLEMFSADEELTTGDVLVMAPRIEEYVPYIQSVFDSRAREGHRIPYTIADRSPGNRIRIINGFLALLDMKNSRFEAGKILALVDSPGIRDRFELSENELILIEKWIRKAGIRWGWDEKSRTAEGLPGTMENTWRHGIQRLLLGYAMPGGGRRMFSGILPFDEIEGNDAETLGKFLTFLEILFSWVEDIGNRRTPEEWTERLLILLDQFISVDDSAEETARLLRKSISNVGKWASNAGMQQHVDLGLIQACLVRQLDRHRSATGFLTGAVTFCEMLPMRSIPARVVCLIGMNVDAFPRESVSAGFDLVARFPRKGDRSRRQDDRYLFLETLLSARSVLYISYLGQSIEDNSSVPPSVLVSELMEYLSDGYGVNAEQLTVRHRLQAFSPDYFAESDGLFSYSEPDGETAAILSQGLSGQRPPFFEVPMADPPDSFRQTDVQRLCGFLMHPARFLLQNRLGLYLYGATPAIENSEKFVFDGLDRFLMGGEVADCRSEGMDWMAVMDLQRASGALPHGSPGELQFREIDAETEGFVNKLNAAKTDGRRQQTVVRLERGEFVITGNLGERFGKRLVSARYANVHPRDLLDAWTRHLLLGALDSEVNDATTWLLGKDAVYEFSTVASDTAYLDELLDLYWQGMTRPLPFFPITSHEFAATVCLKGKGRDEALNAAMRKFQGSEFSRGEAEDPYIDLCFAAADPFTEEFEQIALQIFEPVFNYRKKLFL